MKKFLALVAGSLATFSFGQCTISGNYLIKLNESAIFNTDSQAQCEECYFWKSSNDHNLKIEGNSKTSQISVKASGLGKSMISVSMLTYKGAAQCDKIIEVVEAEKIISKNNCGVQINDFKDVKVTQSTISFFPNENSNDYDYNWAISYINGDLQESLEKIPQFFFSEINYITKVQLRITPKSSICSVTLTKNFEQNYWKSKDENIGKIEQKIYSQGSYSGYMKSADKAKETIGQE